MPAAHRRCRTSSAIDRLGREDSGGWLLVELLLLAEAGHRAILSAIETGTSWRVNRPASWWFSARPGKRKRRPNEPAHIGHRTPLYGRAPFFEPACITSASSMRHQDARCT
ncbi:hypothetical protein K0M31_013888 [Melipona bicolor]|uniref:Uncharacterized protein n=1 Tax=Melipona bicolor TaxID=60889 RepID=A0AA40G7Q0_9HYME|nr:hypothetical protein K0M31_013888 [Melipona bicolor]